MGAEEKVESSYSDDGQRMIKQALAMRSDALCRSPGPVFGG
jgi:hypothetical protein